MMWRCRWPGLRSRLTRASPACLSRLCGGIVCAVRPEILQTNGRAAGSIAYELAYAARGTFQMPGCTSRTSGVPSSALGTSQVRSPRMLLVASPWQCPDEIPVTPTVRLSMDVETFTCLGCGRWTPEAAVKAGKVQMTGVTVLGQTIPAQMNIMI